MSVFEGIKLFSNIGLELVPILDTRNNVVCIYHIICVLKLTWLLNNQRQNAKSHFIEIN